MNGFLCKKIELITKGKESLRFFAFGNMLLLLVLYLSSSRSIPKTIVTLLYRWLFVLGSGSVAISFIQHALFTPSEPMKVNSCGEKLAKNIDRKLKSPSKIKNKILDISNRKTERIKKEILKLFLKNQSLVTITTAFIFIIIYYHNSYKAGFKHHGKIGGSLINLTQIMTGGGIGGIFGMLAGGPAGAAIGAATGSVAICYQHLPSKFVLLAAFGLITGWLGGWLLAKSIITTKSGAWLSTIGSAAASTTTKKVIAIATAYMKLEIARKVIIGIATAASIVSLGQMIKIAYIDIFHPIWKVFQKRLYRKYTTQKETLLIQII